MGIEGLAHSYQDDQVLVMDVANDEDESRNLTTAPQPPAKPKQPTIPPLVSGAHGSANQPQSNNVPLTTTTNNNNQQLTGGAHGSASQLVHDVADGSSSRPPYTQAEKKQVLLQGPTPPSSGSGSVAHGDATNPGGTTKVNMDDPRIPWRPHHRDKTGHWVDMYGNRMDKRSWRVPYIPLEQWNTKSFKRKVELYDQFRESLIRDTGFDIAWERKPPNWQPRIPLVPNPGTAGPTSTQLGP